MLNNRYGLVAQLAEHLTVDQTPQGMGVRVPPSPYAPIAHRIERLAPTKQVTGSIPVGG